MCKQMLVPALLTLSRAINSGIGKLVLIHLILALKTGTAWNFEASINIPKQVVIRVSNYSLGLDMLVS